jgi:hypothetical protein
MIWYGLTLSLKRYQQFNTRLRRPCQECPRVVIHHIVARGTFDERLVKLSVRKVKTERRITRVTKLHLEKSFKLSFCRNGLINHFFIEKELFNFIVICYMVYQM